MQRVDLAREARSRRCICGCSFGEQDHHRRCVGCVVCSERYSRRRRAESRVEPEVTDLWWVIRQQRRYWHIRRTCIVPFVEAGMGGAGAAPRFIRPSGRWLSVRHRSPSGDLDADEAERRAVRGTESLFGHYRPKSSSSVGPGVEWLAPLATAS